MGYIFSPGLINAYKGEYTGIFICIVVYRCEMQGAWSLGMSPWGCEDGLAEPGCRAEPAPAAPSPVRNWQQRRTLNHCSKVDKITYFRPDNPPNIIGGFSSLLSDLLKTYCRK